MPTAPSPVSTPTTAIAISWPRNHSRSAVPLACSASSVVARACAGSSSKTPRRYSCGCAARYTAPASTRNRLATPPVMLSANAPARGARLDTRAGAWRVSSSSVGPRGPAATQSWKRVHACGNVRCKAPTSEASCEPNSHSSAINPTVSTTTTRASAHPSDTRVWRVTQLANARSNTATTIAPKTISNRSDNVHSIHAHATRASTMITRTAKARRSEEGMGHSLQKQAQSLAKPARRTCRHTVQQRRTRQ
ncbi:hypothetical protein FHT10_003344 [Xanthomonas arboricola]|nr:hypothetical protein [Xanthomonas cannabis]